MTGIIDARKLRLIKAPPREWSARADCCSIRFRLAVWAARRERR